MPIFDTPDRITVTIDVAVGETRIVATDRVTTDVQVRPTDPGHAADVRAAELARVELVAGRLLVRTPKPRGLISTVGRAGSVDVTVEVPTGSHLDGTTVAGSFRCSGRLGDCRLKTSAGDLQVEDTAGLDLTTGAGAVTARHAGGDATVSTAQGRIRVNAIDGTAVIRTSAGDAWIGQAGGDLRVNTANGSIAVDRAGADLTAATAHGDLRVGELVRGQASLKTAKGRIEVGIRAGTAARLDLHTSFGTVINDLAAVPGPAGTDQTVQVRAETSMGDILIRRSIIPDPITPEEHR